MSIIQTFYDHLATHYDKLFEDWQSATQEQGALLDRIFKEYGVKPSACVLDCACGIGTQSVGLASLGYCVTASDLSGGALAEAKARAAERGLGIVFQRADFRALSDTFSTLFDAVIAMDNALPHMLSHDALTAAIKSIAGQLKSGGIFVASIRDYDCLLADKPPYSAPYIHKTEHGQRVSFQTWDWSGEHYKLTQYIIDDEGTPQIGKFECEYRATRRSEITELLLAHGCRRVTWKFPEDTGFYQPIVVAIK